MEGSVTHGRTTDLALQIARPASARALRLGRGSGRSGRLRFGAAAGRSFGGRAAATGSLFGCFGARSRRRGIDGRRLGGRRCRNFGFRRGCRGGRRGERSFFRSSSEEGNGNDEDERRGASSNQQPHRLLLLYFGLICLDVSKRCRKEKRRRRSHGGGHGLRGGLRLLRLGESVQIDETRVVVLRHRR